MIKIYVYDIATRKLINTYNTLKECCVDLEIGYDTGQKHARFNRWNKENPKLYHDHLLITPNEYSLDELPSYKHRIGGINNLTPPREYFAYKYSTREYIGKFNQMETNSIFNVPYSTLSRFVNKFVFSAIDLYFETATADDPDPEYEPVSETEIFNFYFDGNLIHSTYNTKRIAIILGVKRQYIKRHSEYDIAMNEYSYYCTPEEAKLIQETSGLYDYKDPVKILLDYENNL